MGKIDNLESSDIKELWEAIKLLQRASPVGFTSVTHGSLRILSPEGFYVGGDASAFVDGLLKVLGTLDVTGTFTVSGIGTISGSFTVTGPFTVEGNTSMTGTFTSTGEFTLTGPFHINGETDLNGTMTVHSSGKIVIEGPTPLTLEAGKLTAGSGEVSGLSNGISINTGSAGLETFLGLVRMYAGGETATLGASGEFDVSDAARIRGPLRALADIYATGLPTTTVVATGVLWADSAGRVFIGA